MSNLISAPNLFKKLDDTNLVTVDIRFDLKDSKKGWQEYQKAHLPKAIFFDLDKDLSSEVREHGGRHPLPDWETFVRKLENSGISNHSSIVVYDDVSGAFAGRFWWMLKYLGHNDVKILDGGFRTWTDAMYPIETDLPKPSKGKFVVNFRHEMLVSVKEVITAISNPKAAIVDAREAKRYSGEVEPIDNKAGHIPNAVNIPFSENLIERKFKSKEALKELYSKLEGAKEIIVYCGSGVTANHDIIAMKEAGFANVKLYSGSWSDWISYADNPIA